MKLDDARRLLDRVSVLRHPCDIDLLVFFARHPRSLLTSEHLASLLGYELKQIADSLEILLEAGFLTRTQNPTHAARLYVFDVTGASGDWLPGLLELASTREGRQALKEGLPGGARSDTGGSLAHAPRGSATLHAPHRFMVRRQSDSTPEAEPDEGPGERYG
jgi:hypothetical protein